MRRDVAELPHTVVLTTTGSVCQVVTLDAKSGHHAVSGAVLAQSLLVACCYASIQASCVAVQVVKNLIYKMQAQHTLGQAHAELKPDCIMLTSRGQVELQGMLYKVTLASSIPQP